MCLNFKINFKSEKMPKSVPHKLLGEMFSSYFYRSNEHMTNTVCLTNCFSCLSSAFWSLANCFCVLFNSLFCCRICSENKRVHRLTESNPSLSQIRVRVKWPSHWSAVCSLRKYKVCCKHKYVYNSPQCFPNQQMKANSKQTGVKLAASEPEWN